MQTRSPYDCVVAGNRRSELIAPVLSYVTNHLAASAPKQWARGYVVYVVDAVAEWPHYARTFSPDPIEPGSTVVDAKDRPTLGIDVRDDTGLLYVSGPNMETTFYCLKVDPTTSAVGVDMFVQIAP
jgi:hypothetical protein